MNQPNELWEEKNLTEPLMNCESNQTIVPNDITNETKEKSLLPECRGIGNLWKRNCPTCNREMWYKRESNWIRGDRKNKLCDNCHNKKKAQTGCYRRNCPSCNKLVVYKSKRGYFNCKRHNCLCRSCATSKRLKGKPSNRKGCHLSDEQKKRIGETTAFRHKMYGHPMTGRHHTKEAKQKIKMAVRGSNNGMYGKTHSIEVRKRLRKFHMGRPGPTMSPDGLRRLRIKRINEISKAKYEGGQIMPSYNREACNFFNKLNERLKWNGQYAINGGEYHIKELGYFVDYYEPTLNLIIEWDENIHYDIDGNLRIKDKNREEEIKSHLKCNFIRIKESEFQEENVIKMIYESTTNK